MAFYSGCSLIVAIPQDYSKRDDLSDFAGHSLDVGQIHTTVGVRRRWNCNEDHPGIIDSVLDPGAKG